MAQAWLGGASHGAMQQDDDSEDTEMSEVDESDSEEEEFDDEGSPHGTKGRDTCVPVCKHLLASNAAMPIGESRCTKDLDTPAPLTQDTRHQ
jgi:hypothetical protein